MVKDENKQKLIVGILVLQKNVHLNNSFCGMIILENVFHQLKLCTERLNLLRTIFLMKNSRMRARCKEVTV
jgi:hypothetical protein